ncbi:MAG: hypothetical protein HY964_05225 [Ignavibacteriales bacterium]|nr:hypothetical protein [Ignavibacteriales bacterium]
MKRVYLSGGMEYADGEGINWRKEMQDWIQTKLSHSVFNPNVESDLFFESKYPRVDFREIKKTDIKLYQEIVRHLVDIDCKEIADLSDYVICYWDEGAAKGAGTKGELTMARYFNKPVYLVTSFNLHDIPGWVLGCTTEIFPDFDSLKLYLSKNQ